MTHEWPASVHIHTRLNANALIHVTKHATSPCGMDAVTQMKAAHASTTPCVHAYTHLRTCCCCAKSMRTHKRINVHDTTSCIHEAKRARIKYVLRSQAAFLTTYAAGWVHPV
eukprot:GDKI01038580.1.p1 GENE.GDKI01038580.1~~GDKI01038580.1.p1  ORF type:complete len:112 (+),score=16.20 GDKI01038580.1:191-526(+)